MSISTAFGTKAAPSKEQLLGLLDACITSAGESPAVSDSFMGSFRPYIYDPDTQQALLAAVDAFLEQNLLEKARLFIRHAPRSVGESAFNVSLFERKILVDKRRFDEGSSQASDLTTFLEDYKKYEGKRAVLLQKLCTYAIGHLLSSSPRQTLHIISGNAFAYGPVPFIIEQYYTSLDAVFWGANPDMALEHAMKTERNESFKKHEQLERLGQWAKDNLLAQLAADPETARNLAINPGLEPGHGGEHTHRACAEVLLDPRAKMTGLQESYEKRKALLAMKEYLAASKMEWKPAFISLCRDSLRKEYSPESDLQVHMMIFDLEPQPQDAATILDRWTKLPPKDKVFPAGQREQLNSLSRVIVQDYPDITARACTAWNSCYAEQRKDPLNREQVCNYFLEAFHARNIGNPSPALAEFKDHVQKNWIDLQEQFVRRLPLGQHGFMPTREKSPHLASAIDALERRLETQPDPMSAERFRELHPVTPPRLDF